MNIEKNIIRKTFDPSSPLKSDLRTLSYVFESDFPDYLTEYKDRYTAPKLSIINPYKVNTVIL